MDDQKEAIREMWAAVEGHLRGLSPESAHRVRLRVQGIVAGDDITAWRDQNGTPIPWAERPRLLRLALAESLASDTKLRNALVFVVIPQQLDPFAVTSSKDAKPKPGTEAAGVKSEAPAQYRTGSTTGGLEPIGGKDTKAPVDFEAERVRRWTDENQMESEKLLLRVASRVARETPPELAERAPKALQAKVDAEYRKAVLEILKGDNDEAAA